MAQESTPNVLEDSTASRFLNVLRAVERFPLSDLIMHQARRVESLVRHARAHVPFYADRLKAVFDADDVVDLSRWQDVPALTTDEARANAAAMTARAVPKFAGEVVQDQTSGTGGEPFHFYRSAAAMNADAANSLRIFIDHAFDTDGRFADLRLDVAGKAPYPGGQLRSGWSFGQGRGDYAILDINTPVADQVEWLIRMQPAVLFTWAMNARAIALLLEEAGERLPLTTLATSAEVCTAGVRADCRRVFGLDPVDIFGVREIGVVAWHCHAGPHYHIAAESAFIEVIGEDGKPAGPGETGRLVATSLYNFHMPFIRYVTGDYVTLAVGRCPCGRTLPALSAIRGRERNRLRLPNGTRVFPVVPEAALDVLIGPLCWRLVQDAPEQVAVAIEADALPRAQAAMAAVRQAIMDAFGNAFQVDLRIADAAPPGIWRKKRELFRSLLQ
jgi:phenylacetate-CoA ligase